MDGVRFLDLDAQRRRLGGRIEQAMAAVVAHGQYILGPEVATLEERLARAAGVAEAVTCGNGTDALVLALRAAGVGAGDAVLVPDFTFVATAEAVVLAGAVPVFVDVDDQTCNLDPAGLAAGLAAARAAGLRTKALIAVDLFGHPADYPGLRQAAAAAGLTVISDAAQAFGARLDGRPVAVHADITATSFFPSKPLGCYGDGGAILTDSPETAALLRSVRMHGKGRDKYDNVRIGTNSRLDTLQAAVLLEKLAILDAEIAERAAAAARYSAALANLVGVPCARPGAQPAWALYTIRSDRRDAIHDACTEAGVPTAIYYAVPLSRQPAYRGYPVAASGCPVSARLSATVLSLPLHPYLTGDQQSRVIDAVRTGSAG